MPVPFDYAPYTLAAQRHMHEMGDSLRRNRFEDAAAHIKGTIVELRLALAAVNDMNDKAKSRGF